MISKGGKFFFFPLNRLGVQLQLSLLSVFRHVCQARTEAVYTLKNYPDVSDLEKRLLEVVCSSYKHQRKATAFVCGNLKQS